MEEREGFELPIVYTSGDDAPILFANQFTIQFHQDEFILTIAQIQPPILLGSAEERRALAARLTHVPIRTLVRVGMTRTRLAELAEILAGHLQRYDEQKETEE